MSIFGIATSDLIQPRYEANPAHYTPSEELSMAVKVAIKLKQPLLLTGEPGTGKTQLAYAIAYDLHRHHPDFLADPLVFHTKTTSQASDLFYTYDAVRHFHDANIKKIEEKALNPISDYIQLQALGQAIAMSNPREVIRGDYVPKALSGAKSSVVLIDEIDKAPRDFPNDILHEIENFEFEIQEADHYRIRRGEEKQIIVIMTSNSEKNLPDAFLRRCVFFHIPFPDERQLLEIVRKQPWNDVRYASEELIAHFLEIRELIKKKKPATSELLTWLRILELEGFLEEGFSWQELKSRKQEVLRYSYSVLAKTSEDLMTIKHKLY